MRLQKVCVTGNFHVIQFVILLVFEVLDCAKTLESSIHHDGQSCTESFTFLHTVDKIKTKCF